MKTIVLSIILWLAVPFFASADILSPPTNGIYIAVIELKGNQSGIKTNEPFQFNDQLYWAAYCNTGRATVWYPIDPSYGIKVKMFRADGSEVEKTSLGESYGSKWDKLHSYKDARLQPSYPEGSFDENHGEGSGGFISSAQNLFKIKEPGIYTMQIEIQMFRYVATRDVDIWSRNLLRFQPVKIKIVRPP